MVISHLGYYSYLVTTAITLLVVPNRFIKRNFETQPMGILNTNLAAILETEMVIISIHQGIESPGNLSLGYLNLMLAANQAGTGSRERSVLWICDFASFEFGF